MIHFKMFSLQASEWVGLWLCLLTKDGQHPLAVVLKNKDHMV